MSTFDAMAYWKKKDEQKKTNSRKEAHKSSFSPKTTKSNEFDALTYWKKKDASKEVGLDTLQTDLTSLSKNIGNVLNGWQTKETMINTLSSVQSMYDRLGKYQEYYKTYGGTDLSELQSSYKSVLDGWEDLSRQYGRYKSADEYTKAIKSAKDKLAEDEKAKTDDLGVVKSEIADMEKIYNTASDMTKILSNQSLNVRSVSDAQRVKNTYDKNTKDREAYVKSMGYESYDALEKALGNKKTYLNRAEWIQKGIELASVGGKDFEEKSKYVAPEEKSGFVFGSTYDDDVYKYINGEDIGYINDSASAGMLTVGYEYMTDQEKKTYNYYYNSGDKEKAKEYLNTITESLGSRKAMADFEGYKGKTFKELAYGVNAGLNQFMTGMKNLTKTTTSDEYIPVDATQQLSGMIRDDLNYEHGNWGAVPYDFITTTSNMLPSILTSTLIGKVNPGLGAKVGATLMGASAGGNAYQEMLNLGYDKKQAITYAGLVGVSEASLQSAIGGIGKLGGIGGNTSSLIKSIDNAFGRFAINYGKSIVAEGFEEAAQEVLNPIFQNIAAGFDTGAEVDWGEVVYSGLLGMLSGGFWEGGPAVSQARAEVQAGKDIKANERVSDLFDIANNPEIAEAYETYTRYANKGINAENVSNAQLGRLYNEVKADAVEKVNSKKSSDEQRTNAYKTLAELSIVDTENTVKKEAQKLNVGEETKVNNSGVAVDVKNLKVKGDDVTFATEKGDVSVDDMTITQRDAELVVIAKGIAQTEGENVANLFLNQYDGKTNVEEYANSFNLTMAYAKNNYRYDTILNKKGELSAETVSAIYQEVRIKADQDQKARFKKLAKQMADKKFYKGFIDESAIDYDNTSAEGKVNWNDLTQTQREAVTFVKGFAQATGMNLVFVANNPKFNGRYSKTKNTLTINLDKGGYDAIRNIKESIIPTMSHETTHWMKEKSPELWRHLNEIVFSTLTEHYNSNTEQAIKDKIALLDRLDPRTKHTEEDARERNITEEDLIQAEMNRNGDTEDVSREEIIARACEDLLKMSEQGRKIFSSLSKSEQTTLFEKIKAIITDLMNWVNDLLNSYESTSAEARIMREYKEQLEKASKVWDKMLEDSVKVNQALEKSGAFEHNSINSSELFSVKNVDGKKYLYDIVSIKKDNVSSAWLSNKITSPTKQVVGQKNNVSKDIILNSAKDVNTEISNNITDDYAKAQEMQVEINQLTEKIRELEKSDEFGRVMDVLTKSIENNDTENGIAEYNKWLNESGYNKAKERRDALQSERDKLMSDLHASYEQKALDEEKQAIEKSGLSEADYFRKQAVKEFGYTPYFYDAGYITPNGKMLNFSGEKGQHYGARGEDHRAIGRVYANVEGSKAMFKFMNEGNIRIMPESPGLDISSNVKPSTEQYATIRKFVREYANQEYFNIDITDTDGHTIGNYEYEGKISAERVVNDIKYFFENGTTREQSSISQFLYSEKDSDYLNAVENGDMETASRMVEEAAENAFSNSKVRDDNGKLKLVYHGTVNEFTVFDRQFANIEGDFGKGYYFTSNEYDVDENYANEEGPDLKNKIYRLAERLEFDDEYSDLSYEKIEEIARQRLITSEPNTITAYLNMKNPVYITPDENGTFLDYNESYDEEYDEYGEPEGLLIDFVEALSDISSDYAYNDVDFSFIYEYAYDNGGVYASDIVKTIKHRIVDELTDENGDIATNEVIRLAFEQIGFDGIIDTAVYYKFNNMRGMDSGTTHYIVFNENQIKSAEPVTYDDNGNIIPLSQRFNAENDDIRYSEKDYSYETMIAKPDMKLTVMDGNVPNNRADIIYQAKKKAAKIGKFNTKNKTVSVFVDDIGRDVLIGTDGL